MTYFAGFHEISAITNTNEIVLFLSPSPYLHPIQNSSNSKFSTTKFQIATHKHSYNFSQFGCYFYDSRHLIWLRWFLITQTWLRFTDIFFPSMTPIPFINSCKLFLNSFFLIARKAEKQMNFFLQVASLHPFYTPPQSLRLHKCEDNWNEAG